MKWNGIKSVWIENNLYHNGYECAAEHQYKFGHFDVRFNMTNTFHFDISSHCIVCIMCIICIVLNIMSNNWINHHECCVLVAKLHASESSQQHLKLNTHNKSFCFDFGSVVSHRTAANEYSEFMRFLLPIARYFTVAGIMLVGWSPCV